MPDDPQATAAKAIRLLLDVASAAWVLADNTEEEFGRDLVRSEAKDFADLSAALEALDTLPDDQPGYTMEPPAKARWALRDLTLGAPVKELPAAFYRSHQNLIFSMWVASGRPDIVRFVPLSHEAGPPLDPRSIDDETVLTAISVRCWNADGVMRCEAASLADLGAARDWVAAEKAARHG